MNRPATSLTLFPEPPVAAAATHAPDRATPPREGRALRRLRAALAEADVAIAGAGETARAWDIRMLDDRLPRRVLINGALGLGDAYVDAWWECGDLPELFNRLLRRSTAARLFDRHMLALVARQRLANAHRRAAAFANGQDHYDRGNALFDAMLDRRLTYTCGYWRRRAAAQGVQWWDGTLDEAQEAKLAMTCRKLGLTPGDRVLDIGCGWGSFARYAAEKHGAHVTGITVARQQVELARERCRGLPCDFRLEDYRDTRGERFDHVVSLGMFEHVGHRNHRIYMESARRLLKPDGLFLLHTISTRRSQPNLADVEISWLDRHIFPGLCIPSLSQIGRAIEGLFTIEDLHNIGAHYEPTLLAWFDNFDRNWPDLRPRYEPAADRFYRMWKYYLQIAAGAFRSRKYGVWQIVLSPAGVRGGYERQS